MSGEEILYNEALGNEWIDWVEGANPHGTREQEIYPFIKSWLEKEAPKSLADIGCGQGICSTLVNDEMQYIGIDPSHALIERAQKLYSSPNKKFIKGDALHLPLEDASVDAAISVWVWSHIENLEQAAKEMSRCLKSGGAFLIITAHPETYEERKTFYSSYTEKDGLLTGTFDLGNGKFLTNSTLYLHSKKRIENAIRAAGLVIDEIGKMGKAETSDKGLYLVIGGSKLSP